LQSSFVRVTILNSSKPLLKLAALFGLAVLARQLCELRGGLSALLERAAQFEEAGWKPASRMQSCPTNQRLSHQEIVAARTHQRSLIV
jgi:hypothetical protein